MHLFSLRYVIHSFEDRAGHEQSLPIERRADS